MKSLAIVGGICSEESGETRRLQLSVVLIDLTSWGWSELDFNNPDIHLSSTKLLVIGDKKLLYFGGYTNRGTSTKQQENKKTSFWGIVTFVQEPQKMFSAQWQGKPCQLKPFACADAIQVGEEVLISCGTEATWGVLTSKLPPPTPCELPTCTIRQQCRDRSKLADSWIR